MTNQERTRSQRPVRSAMLKSSAFESHYTEYRRAHAWGTRVGAYRRMSGFNTLNAQLLSTETAIELASESYSDRDRENFASAAVESAEKVKEHIQHTQPYDESRFKALRLLTNMPLLMKLKVFQERPNQTQLKRAYDTHRADLVKSYRLASPLVPDPLRAPLEGVIAESYVLLSTQHYALKKHPDMSWVPMPAIGHENSTAAHGSVLQPTWNISVFTALAAEDDLLLTYKAQVKRSEASRYPKNYADDIAMICVTNDLALGSERGIQNRPFVAVSRIMGEIALDATPAQSERWDHRIEKIIDILG